VEEADSVVVAAPAQPEPEEDDTPREGWFARLRKGLTRSSDKIGGGITDIFTKRKLDDETLEELEDLLITADLGPATAAKLSADLAKNRFGKDIAPEEVRAELAAGVARILEPVAKPLTIALPDSQPKTPLVILVAGVNGSGKTTTIGKLGKQLVAQGYSVMLGAGDTFRAAAVEQLQVWGGRIGCPVVTKDIGADAAALAYEAVEKARESGTDILLLDTAGRLQNKANLMEELQKMIRVLKKLDDNAPHQVLLVLDATVGQNAHSQVEIFGEMVNVSGLVVTKLDGSAKGGVIVSLAEKFGLPVHAIGVGEGVDDLRSFKADDFARSLMGL